MEIIVCKNYEEMSKKGAEIIIEKVNEKRNAVLGFATGATPLGLYKELIKAYEEGRVDFSQTESFNLDEYIGLDGSHEASYRYYMDNNFFDKININKKNTHIPDGKSLNVDIECRNYDELLSKKTIDIQVLGVGKNGHIGFNEPGEYLISNTNVEELSESTINANARFFDNIEDVPNFAITMGIASIMKAEKILLMANGSDKIYAIDYLLNSKKISTKVPVSLLNVHKNVTVIIDEIIADKVKI